MPNPATSPDDFKAIKARYLIGSWFLAQIAGGMVSGLLGFSISELTDAITINDPLWTLMGGYLGWAIFLQWVRSYLTSNDISVSSIIGSTRLTQRDMWQAVGVAIGCLVFSMGAGILTFSFLEQLFPQFSDVFQEMMVIQPSAVPWLQNILLTGLLVIVAPTLEEFFFRGLLLHRWAVKWNVARSVIVSSILFGFAHVNPIGLSLFGVMMSLLYLKTNRLVSPVLAHAVNNGIVAIFVWFPQAEPAPTSTESITTGIFCIAIALPFLGWHAYSLWTKRTATLPYISSYRAMQAD
jgi:membrane protease YdiL (CAAX protease family)